MVDTPSTKIRLGLQNTGLQSLQICQVWNPVSYLKTQKIVNIELTVTEIYRILISELIPYYCISKAFMWSYVSYRNVSKFKVETVFDTIQYLREVTYQIVFLEHNIYSNNPKIMCPSARLELMIPYPRVYTRWMNRIFRIVPVHLPGIGPCVPEVPRGIS